MGESGRVVFKLFSPNARRLVSANVDLLGDAVPGWTVKVDPNYDAAQIGGLRYTPTRIGVFNLVVSVTDDLGCIGQTGLKRDVTVK